METGSGGIEVLAKHAPDVDPNSIGPFQKTLDNKLRSAWSQVAAMDDLIKSSLDKENRSSADFHAIGLALTASEDAQNELQLPQGYFCFVASQKSFHADTEKTMGWQVVLDRQADGPVSRTSKNVTMSISNNSASGNSVQFIGIPWGSDELPKPKRPWSRLSRS